VRPAASVYPEPGSNSSLYYLVLFHSLSQGIALFQPRSPSRTASRRPHAAAPLGATAGSQDLSQTTRSSILCFILSKNYFTPFFRREGNAKVIQFLQLEPFFAIYLVKKT
ncbi:MAG: hypothetical protein IKT02_02955, partial [Bacteroidales bacterium]|nr:hypothetical protein [Bacteroidales bacterium]